MHSVALRSVLTISLLFVSLSALAESRIIHKAKYVRVLRETEENNLPKTHLADGTRFEKYAEKGEELPPLPVGEEEADSLNDPRIGQFKDGEITVPVDDNGKVLPGYEYLLKPFNVVIDLDEKDFEEKPKIFDAYNIGAGVKSDGKEKEQVYNPYPNPVHPKPELLPEEGETAGAEYDDVVSEPKEPAPDVPELPKLDYSDSGESDEDMKMEEEVENEKEGNRVGVVPVEERRDGEVIIPSTVIEKANNDKESAETVNEERGDSAERVLKYENDIEEIKKTAVIAEKVADRIEETLEEEAESVGLTEEEVMQLADEFREELYDKVVNNAGAIKEWGFDDQEVDPNSIVAEPREPELPQSIPIVEAESLDGVILPDQELTEEDLAEIEKEIEKELEKEDPEVISNPSEPHVRGGRIGSGVQPDSASSFNVFLQLLVSAVLFLVL